ncbi:flagellar hook-associated protein FlgK [Mangrovihabitans endophyticus]|uniref:Flagellar hook-associated protein 1 n=1 Tax=Mangrovihabitans endophyticus TaxID=1751298 RepID=A0A8J3FMY6_9ACTN|nr:flagellar hook-associated protein FlgK [Mangrovihabitans endophyticus]GGK83014.1 flagellar hook-associated protein 1 [Mangrovihabitans endophyticus]
MGSSFGSINTALSSLYAQRRALDVTGQNIANANTEGYTRQHVVMQSQTGSIRPAMYARSDGLGSGVAVSAVQRVRDEYLENRGRAEHANSAYLTRQTAAYSSIEDVFAEPSDTAMQAQLHDMWDAWADVANNPKDSAARAALIQRSATVADGLNTAHDALAGQWRGTREQLVAYVDEVNTAATHVAQLNDTIVKAQASGVTVNELEDQRDLQVLKLAELTGATASKRPNGAMDVFVGNSTLVSEFTPRQLEVTGALRLEDQGTDPLTLRWADTGTKVTVGGTMGAMSDVMTTIIPAISDELDVIAKNLIDTVNAAHTGGFQLDGTPGTDFFSGTTAGTIAVAISDPSEVAAAATAGTLDNTVADGLADVGTSSTGPDAQYRDMIARLGVAAQSSSRRTEIQATITEQVDSARESTSGVNLDEEMTNLLTYQRGYEAASRVLTTVDAMLDQLINRTGLVGR